MIEQLRIFIVEDDPWYGEILKHHLSLNPDNKVELFPSGSELLKALHLRPALITVDFSLPDMNGEQLYKKIRAVDATVPVIVISGQNDVSTVVELFKLGVADYLIKDESTKDLLWNSVNKIRENLSLKQEVQVLRQQLEDKFDFTNLIKGNSPSMQKIFGLMEKAARSNINVSITGETGTGKELVAQAIHFNSDRSKKPFIAVNMSAIPRELIESELFGHEKGSFTGAFGRKIGKFEEANNGTIFLDEIGELDLSVQSKLLRVLQERELQRVGGNERIKLNVRLIVATHKNLSDEVAKGTFREDLYYRVIGLPVSLPPLRERGSDSLLLARFFLDQYAKENNSRPIGLTAKAKDKLLKYNYPGNIRELKTVIELAAVMSDSTEIEDTDITFTPAGRETDFLNEERSLKDYTQLIIKHYLKKYNNNVMLVADKLDIGKSTIYKLIQEGVIDKDLN